MRGNLENNGNSLVFPRRGDPPPPQEGWFVDPGDPFVHHRVWVDCKKRTVALDMNCLPCKNKAMVPYCKTLKVAVDQVFCSTCSEDKS